MSLLTKLFGIPDINLSKLAKGDKDEMIKAKVLVIPLAETFSMEQAQYVIDHAPATAFLLLARAVEVRKNREAMKG